MPRPVVEPAALETNGAADESIRIEAGLRKGAAGPGTLKPAAEIYGKAKLGWEKEVAQTFDTLPPS